MLPCSAHQRRRVQSWVCPHESKGEEKKGERCRNTITIIINHLCRWGSSPDGFLNLQVSFAILHTRTEQRQERETEGGRGGVEMGLLTNRVERNEIKPGDHIYTYRAVFTYSHHGIFVGGSKVVHFTPERDMNSRADTSANSYDEIYNLPSSCPTFPDCGFRQPNSGVVLTCLDCFLRNGSLYSFEYGVTPSVFLAKVRGGTCTTASSDSPETVIHRAMYLLQNGFGNYDVFQNNCEDFTLYCKTGLLTVDRLGVGRSGQASSVIGAPLAALLSSPLKLLMPSPVGVATVTAGMYCMSRYATDIGVRSDVIKVAVEDLAVNLGWGAGTQEEVEDNGTSNQQIIR